MGTRRMKRFLRDYNPNTHPEAVAVAAVVVESSEKKAD